MNTQNHKMKHQNRFKKHAKWIFVFIPIIIILTITLLSYLKASSFLVLFTAILGIFIWIAIGIILIKKIQLEIQKLVSTLLHIEKANTLSSNVELNAAFEDIKTPLESISEKMQKQEEALQKEKLRRLRSVIDGQDQERNRLSRELHDGLGQSLIAIKLQLENAETLAYSHMRGGIDLAKNMIDSTLEDVRRMCSALMPAELDEFGIVSTLRARCDEMASLAKLNITFENFGSLERIDKKTKIYLYRIAQESLNNITKHARASEAYMKIGTNMSVITLEVKDNGKGFIFDPVNFARRNGLQNMRERVNLLNGTFELTTKPGEGTRILISVPYQTGDGKN